MFEVDLLPVENEDQDGGKSGDAIALRFSRAGGGQAVVVIDGGYQDIGEQLVAHIRNHYGTSTVDLVISTHPDQDHLNGLLTVIKELTVGELLVHQPHMHASRLRDFSNVEALDELIREARRRNVAITEPFAGLKWLKGQVRVLGPSRDCYEELLTQTTASQPVSAKSGASGLWRWWSGRYDSLARKALWMPRETLTDDGTTSARNGSSVITLVTVDADRLLFTGDAGIDALTRAAARYEQIIGKFADYPLDLIQAPHHGSRRNLGPTILNRVLGTPEAPFNRGCSAVISSAKAASKHPSPKVVNALSRRGCQVVATEGHGICVSSGAPQRSGWGPMQPLGPLVEDEANE